MDATSIWVAEHGWCPLVAAIGCCTREIVGFHLGLCGRAQEAITVTEQAATARGIKPGMLTLGTENGSAFCARATLTRLRELGIAHRRGGCRAPDPRPSSRAGSRRSRNARSGPTPTRRSTARSARDKSERGVQGIGRLPSASEAGALH